MVNQLDQTHCLGIKTWVLRRRRDADVASLALLIDGEVHVEHTVDAGFEGILRIFHVLLEEGLHGFLASRIVIVIAVDGWLVVRHLELHWHSELSRCHLALHFSWHPFLHELNHAECLLVELWIA